MWNQFASSEYFIPTRRKDFIWKLFENFNIGKDVQGLTSISRSHFIYSQVKKAEGPRTYSGPTCTMEDADEGRGFPNCIDKHIKSISQGFKLKMKCAEWNMLNCPVLTWWLEKIEWDFNDLSDVSEESGPWHHDTLAQESQAMLCSCLKAQP